MKYIAIMGLGTIGRGVYDLLKENRREIAERLGEEIFVKRILDLRDFPEEEIQRLVTHDVADIIGDPEISVVVETMGGVEPAFSFEISALKAGKHVCTSNKELVENKGPELFAAARENKVNFFFEASVGGGIPIIRALTGSLTAERVGRVSGILNGTTNYILSSMTNEGGTYEEALNKAMQLGYAERNPAADVEGFDAGRKLAILASIITGRRVCFGEISIEGITGITREDIRYSKELGYSIKLIAEASFEDGAVTALVAPRMVRPESALHPINGVQNGIVVCGNMVGKVLFSGEGAGAYATASAVSADVIEALRRCTETVYSGWSSEKADIRDVSGSRYRFFVRAVGYNQEDYDNALSIFGGGSIINAHIQAEFGLVTPEMTEEEFHKKSGELIGFIKSIRIK